MRKQSTCICVDAAEHRGCGTFLEWTEPPFSYRVASRQPGLSEAAEIVLWTHPQSFVAEA